MESREISRISHRVDAEGGGEISHAVNAAIGPEVYEARGACYKFVRIWWRSYLLVGVGLPYATHGITMVSFSRADI